MWRLSYEGQLGAGGSVLLRFGVSLGEMWDEVGWSAWCLLWTEIDVKFAGFLLYATCGQWNDTSLL